MLKPGACRQTIQSGYKPHALIFQDQEGDAEKNDSAELPKLNKGKLRFHFRNSNQDLRTSGMSLMDEPHKKQLENVNDRP